MSLWRIESPGEMPRPLACTPMSAAWKASVAEDKWWATGYAGEQEARCLAMLPLRDRLLSFGGEEACLPCTDEDLDAILSHGQLWYGDDIEMMPGEPSGCHRNSASLWEANRNDVFLCTGYALSDDGMWRQHSWCVTDPSSFQGRVVETTVPRVAYFGFIMTVPEAERFSDENY